VRKNSSSLAASSAAQSAEDTLAAQGAKTSLVAERRPETLALSASHAAGAGQQAADGSVQRQAAAAAAGAAVSADAAANADAAVERARAEKILIVVAIVAECGLRRSLNAV